MLTDTVTILCSECGKRLRGQIANLQRECECPGCKSRFVPLDLIKPPPAHGNLFLKYSGVAFLAVGSRKDANRFVVFAGSTARSEVRVSILWGCERPTRKAIACQLAHSRALVELVLKFRIRHRAIAAVSNGAHYAKTPSEAQKKLRRTSASINH